jgi:hypothetical protein
MTLAAASKRGKLFLSKSFPGLVSEARERDLYQVGSPCQGIGGHEPTSPNCIGFAKLNHAQEPVMVCGAYFYRFFWH